VVLVVLIVVLMVVVVVVLPVCWFTVATKFALFIVRFAYFFLGSF